MTTRWTAKDHAGHAYEIDYIDIQPGTGSRSIAASNPPAGASFMVKIMPDDATVHPARGGAILGYASTPAELGEKFGIDLATMTENQSRPAAHRPLCTCPGTIGQPLDHIEWAA